MTLPAPPQCGHGLLDRKDAILHAYAALTSARRAAFGFAIRRTRSVADIACGECRYVDALFDTKYSFLEVEFEHVAHVRAAARTSASATHAENVGKNIAEDIADVSLESAACSAAPIFEGGMTVPVVHRAFLRIAQHFVRFLGGLEVRFAFFVVRIAIRMMLHRQTTECFFQFIVGRRTLDAQRFVITRLAHDSATFCSIRLSGTNQIAATTAYITQATMGLKKATTIATA